MTRELFHYYSPKDRAIVEQILEIVDDYSQQGFRLTLRQLYYQLVSRDLIPNQEKSYKRIGGIVSDARLGGWMDWDAIEDRARRPEVPSQFDSVEEIMEVALRQFRLPRFAGQQKYVELWVEKDALAGVLAPIAREYHITLMVNRGYSSTSSMRDCGERIRESCNELEIDQAYVLYLGDMDPSGEDMVRDVRMRLHQFVNDGVLVLDDDTSGEPDSLESEFDARIRKPELDVYVEKLALTMAQVEEYDPPPNPAKLSDSRAKAYIEKYGTSSWEVDALPPKELRKIITRRLDMLIDRAKMNLVVEREDAQKARMRKALAAIRTER